MWSLTAGNYEDIFVHSCGTKSQAHGTSIYLYMLGHITTDMRFLCSLESQTISLTT